MSIVFKILLILSLSVPLLAQAQRINLPTNHSPKTQQNECQKLKKQAAIKEDEVEKSKKTIKELNNQIAEAEKNIDELNRQSKN
jgi:peptidoglycan hydrolase CwlO-like protein